MSERHNLLFEARERCNVMVLSGINRTLSTQIVESVVYIDIANNIWDDLKERFSRGNHFCNSYLLQEIHSTKQGERNVTQFYTDMNILWEELVYFKPIPRCTCGGTCKCDMSRMSHNYRNLECVIYFLKGLDQVYNAMKTQILMMEPLPNISRVFSLLIQEERQFNGIGNLDNRVVINLFEKQKIGMALINKVIGKYKIKGVGNCKAEITIGKEVEVEAIIKENNAHIVTD